MAAEKLVVTQEGFDKLKAELEYLKTEKRAEVAEKIKEARDFGDLSENSEYDAALNERNIMEARIDYIEEQLKNIEILDESTIDKKIVSIGSVVTLRDMEYNEDVTYTITGKTESDSAKNKISDQSPLGKALVGKKKGAVVMVEAPGGNFEYKILKIARD
ncbi:MAG: transcription elongation factor GreA [Clostridiales bacterium]|nr:MAG: transcription elongation factor GreA [Clostridiales bacterium]